MESNNNNAYTNYSKGKTGNSPMCFKQRPRYGQNNGVGNNSGSSTSKYPYQNQSGYQYSQSRTYDNPIDSYQAKQYEKGPRHFYNILPNKSNDKHQPSSLYLHNSTSALSLSPSSSSSFSTITQNVLNLPPMKSKKNTRMSSTTTAAKNKQLQISNPQQQQPTTIMENSGYYGYNYNNFYSSNYNMNLMSIAPTPVFGGTDGISPLMWQTITSTPPPKLPQQQNPPMPPQQPPSILPPLPSTDQLPPQLPPLPPQSDPVTASANTVDKNNKVNDQNSAKKTIVKMKLKRKTISNRYKSSKTWSEEDAQLALKAEEENKRKLQKDAILIIRFPDPEISRDIVKNYSTDIESVHFQLNYAPRYCLVHLKAGIDVDKTIEDLSKIPFGTGFLSVDIKQINTKSHCTNLNDIDPYTLYVGNLPTTIACKTLKQHFPGAARIDIGFASRMKYTRYAFIRYQNVQLAIEAYKRMLNAEVGGRTLTIRFRRLSTASEGHNNDDADADVDNSENADNAVDDSEILSQIENENTEPYLHGLKKINPNEDNSNESSIVANKNIVSRTPPVPDETNGIQSSKASVLTTENTSAQMSTISPADNNPTAFSNFSTEIANEAQINIKRDPDDIDDIVTRDKAIISRSDVPKENVIKQEEENALFDEFFAAPPNNQIDKSRDKNADEFSSNDLASVISTTDETDIQSTVSTTSLGMFLQNCQKAGVHKNDVENIGPPTSKRKKTSADVLLATDIKNEFMENIGNESADNTTESISLHANDELSRRRKIQQKTTVVASTNSTTTQSITNINDDIVPPTALFYRNDNQNNYTNIDDNDEFYGTTATTNIKKEPLNISIKRIDNKNCKKGPQIKTFGRITENNENVQSTQNSNISTSVNPTAMSNSLNNDDDLVPAQNILGFYRPVRSAIKQELEHDDILMVPFSKTNKFTEGCDIGTQLNNNESSTNSNLQQNHKNGKISEVSENNTPLKDTDDDVVILSDNISRQAKPTNSNSLLFTSLFFPRQTDLVTFKPKPLAVTISNSVVSKHLHSDYLDKLYEQLDADSDNEL